MEFVLAFCLMPNHFHLAVWPRRDDELSDYMLWLLTAEVRRHQQHYHSSGHVWQACFRAFATPFSSPPFPSLLIKSPRRAFLI